MGKAVKVLLVIGEALFYFVMFFIGAALFWQNQDAILQFLGR